MPPRVTARTSGSITGRSSRPLAVLHAPATATTKIAIVGVHLTRFPSFVKYPSNSPSGRVVSVGTSNALSPSHPAPPPRDGFSGAGSTVWAIWAPAGASGAPVAGDYGVVGFPTKGGRSVAGETYERLAEL